MENTIIKKHNFEVSKSRIQELSSKVPSTVSFKQFATKGSLIPWNNHCVTGKEVNEKLISPLQSSLITQNDNIKSVFSIFQEIYRALDYLDREYINGVVLAVKASEIASSQATEASKKSLDASSKATIAQNDIKRTIEGLRITVSTLKEFKNKVSTELSTISELSSDIYHAKKRMLYIEKGYDNLSYLISDTQNCIASFERRLNEVFICFDALQKQEHYRDIDSIWKNVEEHKNKILRLFTESHMFMGKVNSINEKTNTDLKALQSYRTLLETYTHLSDIDTIWKDVEECKTNLICLRNQLKDFIVEAHELIICNKKSIDDVIEQSINRNLLVDKKIKIAYGIAASSIAITTIQLILQITEIL